MDDQPTCGKGLAENSSLPASLAELMDAMAANLELHTKALDLSDANARQELDAYVKLGSQLRQIASSLAATASEMAGYRDLPMARHDTKAMRDPNLLQAFERFAHREEALFELLRARIERHKGMLAQIRAMKA
jgi:hypothetical protein